MYLPRSEEGAILPHLPSKEAIALIGPRRAGKTTLAKRLVEAWELQGGSGAYIDLEAPGAPSTMRALLDEIEKVPLGGLVALDEVQSAEGWQKAVRFQIENAKRHVIVTGSSASLLSSEIATSLGGRAIPYAVLPLSYSDARAWGMKTMRDYLRTGGYPECVLRPQEAANLHRLYLDLAVLRDVAARKGIREIKPLSDLALLLLSEPGKAISAKKTSERLGISQPTFRSYVQAFNDAFLVLSVPPFLRSPRERLVADAKNYAYDTGLASSVSISASEDDGRKYENLVAVEFARRGYRLSFHKAPGGECDFIAQKAGKKTLAVQVFSGDGELPQREIDGLKEGMRAAKADGLMLTMDGAAPDIPAAARTMGIENWLLGGKPQ